MKNLIVFFLSIVSFALVLDAGNGDLDTSFGPAGTGIVTISNPTGTPPAAGGLGIELQPDSKIVIGGAWVAGMQAATLVGRLLSNGSLDSSFNDPLTSPEPGLVVTALLSFPDVIGKQVALDPNGKIFVGGSPFVVNFTGAITLMKYNNDGTLDTSFGAPNGYVTIQTTLPVPYLYNVHDMVLNNNKVTVVGSAANQNTSKQSIMLARFDATTGALDVTFNNGSSPQAGIIITDIDPSSTDVGNGIVIDTNNKIIITGTSTLGLTPNAVTIRYNDDGSIDSSFGIVTLFDAQGEDVILQPDGKIVIGGGEFSSGHEKLLLVRYNSDGTPDTSFGNGGVVTTDVDPLGAQINALVLQPDGKIVAGGFVVTSAQSPFPFSQFLLARYNADGTLDDTFGDQGIVITTLTAGRSNFINDLVLQPDKKIVVVGISLLYQEALSAGDAIVARYLAGCPADADQSALALALQAKYG